MKLKVITSNLGKVKEFREALRNVDIEIEHLTMPYDEIQTSDLNDVVKTGIESLRSRGLSNFIIDDSGLFVDALGGFPGVYSAYVQKTLGNRGVLKLLENSTDRGAEFRCCIGCDIEGKTVIVNGICRGYIFHEERGGEGFGFDPIFSSDGKRSFAEMPLEEKNIVSHRGLAVKALAEELRRQ